MLTQFTDKTVLQIFHTLPMQFQTEVVNFMQYLVYKANFIVDNQETKEENILTKRQFGYFPKGTFLMTEDFDAPLDCFKEYMQ